ncbi:hypothetical protein [Desulfurobacterium crinifex]
MGLTIWRKKPTGKFFSEDARNFIRFRIKESFVEREKNCIIASPRTVTTFFKTKEGKWEEDFFGLKHIVEEVESILFEKKEFSFAKIVVDEESIKALQEIYKTTCFSADFEHPTVEFVSNS